MPRRPAGLFCPHPYRVHSARQLLQPLLPPRAAATDAARGLPPQALSDTGGHFGQARKQLQDARRAADSGEPEPERPSGACGGGAPRTSLLDRVVSVRCCGIWPLHPGLIVVDTRAYSEPATTAL